MEDFGRFSEKAREFVDNFSSKQKIESVINKDWDSHIPLILSANSVIFAVASTILVSLLDNQLSATKLLVLITVIFSLITILLNIWFMVRIRIRMDKLREAQKEIFKKEEENIARTMNLFSSVIRESLNKRANLLVEGAIDKKALLKELEKEKAEDYLFLIEKGLFIFKGFDELSYYQTLNNLEKILSRPLDEKLSTIKLFLDRLSDRFKHSGLAINSVLLLITLLMATLI